MHLIAKELFVTIEVYIPAHADSVLPHCGISPGGKEANRQNGAHCHNGGSPTPIVEVNDTAMAEALEQEDSTVDPIQGNVEIPI